MASKKVERERRRRRTGQQSNDVGADSGLGGGEQGKVLQVVGPNVTVVGIVRREAVVTQVDAQVGVRKDLVALDPVENGGRAKQRDSIVVIMEYDVGIRAADQVVW